MLEMKKNIVLVQMHKLISILEFRCVLINPLYCVFYIYIMDSAEFAQLFTCDTLHVASLSALLTVKRFVFYIFPSLNKIISFYY